MATARQRLIGENEYLHTSYRPDCDYVDGFVMERNVGTHPHGRLQILIAGSLLQRERQWQIHTVVRGSPKNPGPQVSGAGCDGS